MQHMTNPFVLDSQRGSVWGGSFGDFQPRRLDRCRLRRCTRTEEVPAVDTSYSNNYMYHKNMNALLDTIEGDFAQYVQTALARSSESSLDQQDKN